MLPTKSIITDISKILVNTVQEAIKESNCWLIVYVAVYTFALCKIILILRKVPYSKRYSLLKLSECLYIRMSISMRILIEQMTALDLKYLAPMALHKQQKLSNARIQSNSHRKQKIISRELQILRSSMPCLIEKDLNLGVYKQYTGHLLTIDFKKKRKENSKDFLIW